MNDRNVLGPNVNDSVEVGKYAAYSVNPATGVNTTDAQGNPTGGFYETVGGTKINWQDGPRGKDANGELAAPNGAFVEDTIHAAIQRLKFFQKSKFACRENAIAITKLEEALFIMTHRRHDREARDVHGQHEV